LKRAIRPEVLIAAGLAAACLALYARVFGYGFINYDDNAYVYENPFVSAGFTRAGIVWAFSAIDYFYWQPVTWLSHMLDCHLFGLNAGRHHLVNVVIHSVNAVLAFAVFRRLTGVMWRSTLVAALFALHPLRIESVAWITERKDVLSAFFFLATVCFYLRHAERPGMRRYVPVLGCFALGLMAKPMLLTTPALLLLLDWWPLRRRAIAEKLPLAALSIISLTITYAGTSRLAAINWGAAIPFPHRVANALISYVGYLALSVYPHHLSVLYPYRITIQWWQPLAAATLLGGITVAAIRSRKRRPYLAVGWLWFLIALLPAAGLVQSGRQSMADRFTYLPSIGLTFAVVWGAAELMRNRPCAAAVSSCATVIVLAAASYGHLPVWRDSVTVFQQAVAVTRNNSGAEHYFAAALEDYGRYDEALPHHAAAVRSEPGYYVAHCSYALALERRGEYAAAAEHFRAALALFPAYPEAASHLQALSAVVRSR
jgi:tetratricopeptide (TPR) repeat protein